ncbi:phytanoyl-CoA dioxygenase family protein [Qipengyuania sp. 483]
MNLDVEKFWNDGFFILRKVLPPAKVARWRDAGFQVGPVDLLSDDTLAEVVCEPVLIDAAHQILGGQPVYFGDSTAQRGTGAGCGFHKDNSDRLDVNAPDWKVDRYPIIRFGIYTQPHGRLPYGIDFRQGSHHHPNFDTGRVVSAEVEVGDLVVWNGRTTHSGNSHIFKLTGRRLEPRPTSLAVRLTNKFGLSALFRDHPEERMALFASYALASPSLDRHIEYLRQRTYAVEMWERSEWSPYARDLASEVGLALLDTTQFARDGRPLHAQYHAIPY